MEPSFTSLDIIYFESIYWIIKLTILTIIPVAVIPNWTVTTYQASIWNQIMLTKIQYEKPFIAILSPPEFLLNLKIWIHLHSSLIHCCPSEQASTSLAHLHWLVVKLQYSPFSLPKQLLDALHLQSPSNSSHSSLGGQLTSVHGSVKIVS